MIKKYTILVVEDGIPDQIILSKAFKENKNIKTELIYADNGEMAFDILSEIIPDLIILDLNLPLMSGHEILKIIKNDKNLCHIPVLIFSTSNRSYDINLAYGLHANSYLVKSPEIKDMFEKIRMLAEYWLKIGELPDKSLKNWEKEQL
jgi:CheY-like chemotaxis protein